MNEEFFVKQRKSLFHLGRKYAIFRYSGVIMNQLVVAVRIVKEKRFITGNSYFIVCIFGGRSRRISSIWFLVLYKKVMVDPEMIPILLQLYKLFCQPAVDFIASICNNLHFTVIKKIASLNYVWFNPAYTYKI